MQEKGPGIKYTNKIDNKKSTHIASAEKKVHVPN